MGWRLKLQVGVVACSLPTVKFDAIPHLPEPPKCPGDGKGGTRDAAVLWVALHEAGNERTHVDGVTDGLIAARVDEIA